jgi:hypothetical protein
MNKLDTPDAIYRRIINKGITIESGLDLLISLLQENDNNDFFFRCKGIIEKIYLHYKKTYDVLHLIIKKQQNPSTKFIIVKLFIISFPKKFKRFRTV